MRFSIYQESRPGTRPSNQDRVAYCYSRDALLMLVADGMGGHLNGDVAAEAAARFITEAFQREARPALADPPSFLRRAIAGAHRAIVASAAADGLRGAPLTTCVACVVQDNAACWAHAGDSRLYHLRAGRIMAQTKDHSRVRQLIDQGRMREEAYGAHPERHRIFNCLGSPNPPQIELSGKIPLDAGDTLLLCSDGLWGPLSPKIICSALKKHGIMEAVPELLNEAERRAGRECDNLSVVAVTWEQDSRPRESAAKRAEKELVARARTVDLSDPDIGRALAGIRKPFKRPTDGKT